MAADRPIRVYLTPDVDADLARDVLGGSTVEVPGALEGMTDARGARRLIDAGFAVDSIDTGWADGRTHEAALFEDAMASERQRTSRWAILGRGLLTIIGGLLTGIGALILLQQQGIVDASAQNTAIALLLGLAAAFLAILVRRRRVKEPGADTRI